MTANYHISETLIHLFKTNNEHMSIHALTQAEREVLYEVHRLTLNNKTQVEISHILSMPQGQVERYQSIFDHYSDQTNYDHIMRMRSAEALAYELALRIASGVNIKPEYNQKLKDMLLQLEKESRKN